MTAWKLCDDCCSGFNTNATTKAMCEACERWICDDCLIGDFCAQCAEEILEAPQPQQETE